MEFKDWLYNELNKRNIKPKEFALDFGVSESAVSKYLSGAISPSLQMLLKIAVAWNLPEKDVLYIGGYDEQYRKLPPTVPKKDEEPIELSPDEESKLLDEELNQLCKDIHNLQFSKSKNVKLSNNAKRAVITFIRSALELSNIGKGGGENQTE